MAYDLIDLADQAHARANDRDTSKAAADAVTAKGLRKIQIEVLGYAFERGDQGFTDFEMQAHFEDMGSTYRSRRAELCDLLLVDDTGERRARNGKGRKFIVWRITDKGRDYFKGVNHGGVA